ncbi:MAG: hypothetical protein ABSH39_13755 [Candidatus Acidiferrum sp.]
MLIADFNFRPHTFIQHWVTPHASAAAFKITTMLPRKAVFDYEHFQQFNSSGKWNEIPGSETSGLPPAWIFRSAQLLRNVLHGNGAALFC